VNSGVRFAFWRLRHDAERVIRAQRPAHAAGRIRLPASRAATSQGPLNGSR